ncbi:hypothetical protein [Phyllobacterium myrsinacearum]|uniref:Uncharacterized protein n=1 Tax=Phyllobacterium myrsinacearum TaxID=28101 RepID=A0A839EMY4_9HYPH|nr:hypothetical protein [Phyllobacterium myrsinacearum]MBA8878806.1 hypothetical protein [Phyllobacterium myrsinacearum]
MSDQRELNMADCDTCAPAVPASRLLQRMLDMLGYSAVSSLGSGNSSELVSQNWDGLEPFEMLRGWQSEKK